jgi:hypothetical protein
MACSSLYQSLMFTPHVLLGQLASVEQDRPAFAPPTQTGLNSTPPCGLKVRSTSLSLKTTFVRSLLLENGYWIEQFVTGHDRTQVWPAAQAAEVHEVPVGQVHAVPEVLHVPANPDFWLQQPDWHAGTVHGSPSVSWHDVPSEPLV